ncbi:MAG: NAD(P) transhydrogenase subunit alpha [Eubacteriales bacterium]|nr:NAD(P) transhydrogenase subunit alpha [Eubacteriales bacterium]MDD4323334.1 NAD(P) transhydrogenase subunit alpha [Eubacteriales bacterium]MDD4540639.1 NAD(P) transhydrogenase subunit alpha [Eubacteriales bacterium]
MGLEHLILIVVFVVSMLVGYKIIDRVPSLLHTPLMSGMNAYSGVTVLGCLTATAVASSMGDTFSRVLGFIAIVLAMINVVGGFAVTDRMLRMFHSEDKTGGGK